MKPIYKQLEFKELNVSELTAKVLFYDPAPIYERVTTINPLNRYQELYFHQMFPNLTQGECACSCGKKLTGRRTRWATKDCAKFPVLVWSIIAGRTADIRKYLQIYQGYGCALCGDMDCERELDHIIPVHKGGGGCWLNNYQLICKSCHKEKTKSDVAKPKKIIEGFLFKSQL